MYRKVQQIFVTFVNLRLREEKQFSPNKTWHIGKSGSNRQTLTLQSKPPSKISVQYKATPLPASHQHFFSQNRFRQSLTAPILQ